MQLKLFRILIIIIVIALACIVIIMLSYTPFIETFQNITKYKIPIVASISRDSKFLKKSDDNTEVQFAWSDSGNTIFLFHKIDDDNVAIYNHTTKSYITLGDEEKVLLVASDGTVTTDEKAKFLLSQNDDETFSFYNESYGSYLKLDTDTQVVSHSATLDDTAKFDVTSHTKRNRETYIHYSRTSYSVEWDADWSPEINNSGQWTAGVTNDEQYLVGEIDTAQKLTTIEFQSTDDGKVLTFELIKKIPSFFNY